MISEECLDKGLDALHSLEVGQILTRDVVNEKDAKKLRDDAHKFSFTFKKEEVPKILKKVDEIADKMEKGEYTSANIDIILLERKIIIDVFNTVIDCEKKGTKIVTSDP